MSSLRDKVISTANPNKGTRVTAPVPVARPVPKTLDQLAELDSLEELFDISQLNKTPPTT